jgi:hypothetical protein
VIYPDLPSATRPVPQSGEFLVPKPPKNLTFSDNNTDSDEDYLQQGDNADCNPTFEASCSPSETHLLSQGDLIGIVINWNLFKKQAKFLGFRLKLWNLLHQHTDICFFYNSQNEFKEYFPQGNYLVFGNDLGSLIDLLDTDAIHLSGVYLLTIQKLA